MSGELITDRKKACIGRDCCKPQIFIACCERARRCCLWSMAKMVPLDIRKITSNDQPSEPVASDPLPLRAAPNKSLYTCKRHSSAKLAVIKFGLALYRVRARFPITLSHPHHGMDAVASYYWYACDRATSRMLLQDKERQCRRLAAAAAQGVTRKCREGSAGIRCKAAGVLVYRNHNADILSTSLVMPHPLSQPSLILLN